MRKNFIIVIISLFSTFYSKSYSQVTVGANKPPEEFSIIEVVSDGKGGFRLPQINKKQRDELGKKILSMPEVTNEEKDKKSRAKGLTIFNTTSELIEYWNGFNWYTVDNTPSIEPEITGGLIKNSQKLLSNSYYPSGTINDILEVTYIGGNGAYYPTGKPYKLTDGGKNITLELQSGKLAATGVLIFKITGEYGTLTADNEIQNIRIDFNGQTLGTIDIVGGSKITQATQYTINGDFFIPQDGSPDGSGGSKFGWIRDGVNVGEYIELPEDGAYVFSFRLYGNCGNFEPTNSIRQQWGYISAHKENNSLVDIAEINMLSLSGATFTYTINLTAAGRAKDKFYFKISIGGSNPEGDNVSTVQRAKFSITLRNGYGSEKRADRTSMIFWKL